VIVSYQLDEMNGFLRYGMKINDEKSLKKSFAPVKDSDVSNGTILFLRGI